MGTTALVWDEMPVCILRSGSSATVILRYKTEYLHLHTFCKKKMKCYWCTYFSRYLQMGGMQVSTEYSREISVLCSNAVLKEKRECSKQEFPFHSCLCSAVAKILLWLRLITTCWGQRPSLSIGSPFPAPQPLPSQRGHHWVEDTSWQGDKGLPSRQRLALPASPCIRLCASQDVVAVLLLSLLPIPAFLAGKCTTFPIQTRTRVLQAIFSGAAHASSDIYGQASRSTQQNNTLDVAEATDLTRACLLLKYEPWREVRIFCSSHSSQWVSKCPQVSSRAMATAQTCRTCSTLWKTGWVGRVLCPAWTSSAGLPWIGIASAERLLGWDCWDSVLYGKKGLGKKRTPSLL